MLLDLRELKPAEKQNWLQHAIGPRPIAFASTIDREGNVNLSPFSFFNMFSSNPPIVIFSPARRVRNNTIKHTLENVYEIPEVVLNICDFEMVQQVSLSSCEFPKEVNEFHKAGFTAKTAKFVKPPMVKEAKVNLECLVKEIKPLGLGGGAGNLIIAEVICMHIDDRILTEDKKTIDQKKLHQIARLGGDWYCSVNENNLFKVPKPNINLGIGIDALPQNIKNSKSLTGNHLGQLANVHELPEIMPNYQNERLKNIVTYYSADPEEMEKELHIYAAVLLEENKVEDAWQVLLTTGE